eukprot:gene8946-10492_t
MSKYALNFPQNSINEKVIVIGHIPCTLQSETFDEWCTTFSSIVERFNTTISTQLFGHTHNDQFSLYSDMATHTVPTGMAYIAPSLTTYTYHEPAFRIYEYDYDTNQVVNFHQYHTNLTEANASGDLKVYHSYNAKELYSMEDLSTVSWWKLAETLKTDGCRPM